MNVPPVVRLELGAGWMVGGRVVDDAGRPLPGSRGAHRRLPGEDPLPEVVRADGKSEWGPVRSDGRVPADTAPPGLRGAPRRADCSSGRGPRARRRAADAGVGAGRQISRPGGRRQRGALVPDATVRCVMPGREDLAVIGDRLPLAAEAAGLPSGSGHALGRTRTISTDSGGRFQLHGHAARAGLLEVSHEGSVPYRAGPIPLLPGQRLELVAVSLLNGVRLTGRVIDESDSPIDGARIAVVGCPARRRPAARRSRRAGPARRRGVRRPEKRRLVTDGGGRFTAAVAEGARQVAVERGRNAGIRR